MRRYIINLVLIKRSISLLVLPFFVKFIYLQNTVILGKIITYILNIPGILQKYPYLGPIPEKWNQDL
jgi:hypothetical protein